MPLITGRLSDFQGNPGLEVHPRIVFRPSGAAVGGTSLFYSRPVIVDTFGPDGSFSVELQSTDELWHIAGDDVWYEVTIDRLVAGADYMPWDHPGWRLKVPAGGGLFSALVVAPTNPAQVWFGPGKRPWMPEGDEPTQALVPSAYTGWYRTNTVPDRGLDNYFEWE
ncbi:hypothetical protein [Microbacterium oleivorans]|uniref:Uncharacterized protein n=1 Tax=Microbacterium oleivorans TaxID=273677 RepID=A0A7D5IRR4_9MICO|nr:hypothetical protein [Microbacterium oleivorans]QLD10877.1 hypothetical protein HW566_03215 [Microbacterium oleivorans]